VMRAQRCGDGRLAVTVEDDGVGFGASQSGSGLGLTNIRERLAQLYGDAATLVLKARAGGGVAATITLPLETDA
jgi:signal transduction histidine kinase